MVRASKIVLVTTLITKEEQVTLATKARREHRGIMVFRAGTTASGSAMFVGLFTFYLNMETNQIKRTSIR